MRFVFRDEDNVIDAQHDFHREDHASQWRIKDRANTACNTASKQHHALAFGQTHGARHRTTDRGGAVDNRTLQSIGTTGRDVNQTAEQAAEDRTSAHVAGFARDRFQRGRDRHIDGERGGVGPRGRFAFPSGRRWYECDRRDDHRYQQPFGLSY